MPGVNPRCLDKGTVDEIEVECFAGDNWESSMEEQKLKPVPIQSRSK